MNLQTSELSALAKNLSFFFTKIPVMIYVIRLILNDVNQLFQMFARTREAIPDGLLSENTVLNPF